MRANKTGSQAGRLEGRCKRAQRHPERRFDKKGISLVVEAPDGLNVLADETALVHSVLSNLLTNAIKFSPSGSSITLHAVPAENGTVRAIVRDRGVGNAAGRVGTPVRSVASDQSSGNRWRNGDRIRHAPGSKIHDAFRRRHRGAVPGCGSASVRSRDGNYARLPGRLIGRIRRWRTSSRRKD